MSASIPFSTAEQTRKTSVVFLDREKRTKLSIKKEIVFCVICLASATYFEYFFESLKNVSQLNSNIRIEGSHYFHCTADKSYLSLTPQISLPSEFRIPSRRRRTDDHLFLRAAIGFTTVGKWRLLSACLLIWERGVARKKWAEQAFSLQSCLSMTMMMICAPVKVN